MKWHENPINVIDTPGHVDFTVEVERSLRVLDGAILVLCSVGGVQSQSLTVDRQMKRYGIPRIAFINKMDRIGANPFSVIEQIKDKLGVLPCPLQVPMGAESRLEGVVDLIQMKSVYFDGEDGEDVRREEIPEQYLDLAKEYRSKMLETLSMFDDKLMEALLEEREPTPEELYPIIRRATIAREITPVMMGSAYKNKGVQELLDAVCRFLPSPLDRNITATDLDQKPVVPEGAPEGTKAEPVKVQLKPDDNLPLVAMAFKIIEEQYGQLTFTRIYQGRS